MCVCVHFSLLVRSAGSPVGGRFLFPSPSSPFSAHGCEDCDDIMTANCSRWGGVGWIAAVMFTINVSGFSRLWPNYRLSA